MIQHELQTKENLQEVLGRVLGAYEEKSMIANARRTESMISNARTDFMVMSKKKVNSECDIKVGYGDTEQVKRFKYLGIDLETQYQCALFHIIPIQIDKTETWTKNKYTMKRTEKDDKFFFFLKVSKPKYIALEVGIVRWILKITSKREMECVGYILRKVFMENLMSEERMEEKEIEVSGAAVRELIISSGYSAYTN